MDTQELEEQPVPGPRPIRQLSEDVVNKIAAAEIIHRPSNAIKELLENSLDAGSTSIKVTTKDGGLKSMTIADNGHGIRKRDLPLLCKRFATSKLRAFSDLKSLHTYGFRGEALASISFVSRVNVVTKTESEAIGWKAHYSRGELVNPSGSGSAEPKPSAANQGTIITAEDLFYDVPLRRKSFKSGSDEYNRIIDVITRYAVHNPAVAWICKKHGSTQPEVATPSGSSSLGNIGLLYGSNVSKELIPFGPSSDEDKGIVKVHGYTSGAGHNGKKGILLLFINNRLVESTKFRKAIEAVYTTFLPKGSFPWVYLSLDIEPHRVDVNVHPTKSEVHFLDEDAVVEHVMGEISVALTGANSSRSFNVQTLLPGALEPNVRTVSSSSIPRISSKPVAPQNKIRIDPQDRKLESMSQFARKNPNELGLPPAKRQKANDDSALRNITYTQTDARAGPDVQIISDDEEDDVNSQYHIIETSTSLRSIGKLRRAVAKRSDPGINAVMSKHKYIGLVPKTLQALVQCQAQLYILHFGSFSQELFYQLGLRQFGAYGRLVLEPPPTVRELLQIALDHAPELEAAGLIAAEVLEKSLSILQERTEMLDEYFSLKIDAEGRLRTLPMLLPGYEPPSDALPMLLLGLGVRVDWTDEQECFDTFLRELALFYTPPALDFDLVTDKKLPGEHDHMMTDDVDDTMNTDPSPADKTLIDEVAFAKHQIEHLLFPAMRRYTEFPSHLKANIHEIADYKALFKVFERC